MARYGCWEFLSEGKPKKANFTEEIQVGNN
jgi:hypothetical protein